MNDQSWFWTSRWQEGEREAQVDIDAGRTKRFKTARALIDEVSGSGSSLARPKPLGSNPTTIARKLRPLVLATEEG